MPDAHPFRFAVQASGAESAAQWRERAREVEELGHGFAPVVAALAGS
jgi:hypothetical protein